MVNEYVLDDERNFMNQVMLDMKKGITTYVYNPKIIEKLKEIFDDLEVERVEFYWIVKSKKAKKMVKGSGKVIKYE